MKCPARKTLRDRSKSLSKSRSENISKKCRRCPGDQNPSRAPTSSDEKVSKSAQIVSKLAQIISKSAQIVPNPRIIQRLQKLQQTFSTRDRFHKLRISYRCTLDYFRYPSFTKTHHPPYHPTSSIRLTIHTPHTIPYLHIISLPPRHNLSLHPNAHKTSPKPVSNSNTPFQFIFKFFQVSLSPYSLSILHPVPLFPFSPHPFLIPSSPHPFLAPSIHHSNTTTPTPTPPKPSTPPTPPSANQTPETTKKRHGGYKILRIRIRTRIQNAESCKAAHARIKKEFRERKSSRFTRD